MGNKGSRVKRGPLVPKDRLGLPVRGQLDHRDLQDLRSFSSTRPLMGRWGRQGLLGWRVLLGVRDPRAPLDPRGLPSSSLGRMERMEILGLRVGMGWLGVMAPRERRDPLGLRYSWWRRTERMENGDPQDLLGQMDQ